MAELGMQDFLFHIFAVVATLSALLVVFMSNPIYSSFFLALVMSVLAVFFFMLDAQFVAAAQMIVYAGAVVVLFVMVMMLFDLKRDADDVARFTPMIFFKILGCGVLCGIFMGAGWMVSNDGAGFIAKYSANAAQTMVLKNPGNAPSADTQNPDELKKEIVEITQNPKDANIFKDYSDTQKLSLRLFSKFVFAFEILSLLLLVAIVGAVALARSKGGTHHASKRRA